MLILECKPFNGGHNFFNTRSRELFPQPTRMAQQSRHGDSLPQEPCLTSSPENENISVAFEHQVQSCTQFEKRRLRMEPIAISHNATTTETDPPPEACHHWEGLHSIH